MLDKKSKVFFTFFVLAIVVSIGATYYRFVELRDFETSWSEQEEVTELIEE